MIAALCTILSLLAAPTLGQDSEDLTPPSPCPTVFTYDPPGAESGWWSGAIKLSTDFLLHSVWLDIVLDTQALKLLHKTAEATTQNFKNFRIDNEEMQIQPGIPTSLPFSVQYDTNDEIPRLQAIRLNGIVICNALLAAGQKDSKLKTNVNSNMRPVLKLLKQSPVSPRPDNKTETETDSGNISNAGDDLSGNLGQTQCGTSSLVSQWPWVAAVYKFDVKNGYYCGGTLLSHRHVITSAKCTHEGKSSSTPVINKNSLVVRLGKHDLSSVLGVQIRLVQKIIESTDFVNEELVYTGLDVAVLVLHEPVTYTDWVRPLCLWPISEVDPDSFIGKKGWLVGWGFDEKDEVIEQLSEDEISVVKPETCVKSKGYAKFNLTAAKNWYCAGDQQDTVLCKGVDIGNSMVFKMGNTWYLRGQLTFFFNRKLKTFDTCDPTEYFQFADVAKYYTWIHDIISIYL